MATQTITVDAYQLLLAECSDYLASKNYTEAYNKWVQASAVLSALELDISDGAASIRRRDSLDKLGDAIDKASTIVGKTTNKNRSYKLKTSHRR